jgi:uncharacterized membrane protein YccC
MTGVRYGVRILVGSSLLWLLLSVLADQNPIWAISSMVAVTEPQLQVARSNFRARVENTAVGGLMGLLFLLVAGPRDWVLPLAMTATVFVSMYIVRVQTYWRIAPITAALVMAGGLQKHSRHSGVEVGFRRLAEVLLGSAMALAVAFVFAKIWPLPPDSEAVRAKR